MQPIKFIRRIFTASAMMIGVLGAVDCWAGPIANIQYVHEYIEQSTGIDVPIKTTNQTAPANTKYLLAAIDKINELSVGSAATDYKNNVLATENAIPVETVWAAVSRLHNCDADGFAKTGTINAATGAGTSNCAFIPEFTVTLTDIPAGGKFSFQMATIGNYYVDWGDGTGQTITKTATSNMTYTHTYAAAGNYNVGLSGNTTACNTSPTIAAISFNASINKTKITALAGDLGGIFPRMPNLRFYQTFMGLTGLTSVPGTLFASVVGAPTLTGMFHSTFEGCTGLTSLPSGLFTGVNGVPTESLFRRTFWGCDGLTTIPQNLFGAFTGAPAELMFSNTFGQCSGITSIADGIWDLSGLTNSTIADMFYNTFANMPNLTSSSPKIAPGSDVELWEKFTVYTGQTAFIGNAKMSNYCDIPSAWGGGIGTATCFTPEFSVQLTDMTASSTFNFQMSAQGNFQIDWGDGTIQVLNRAGVTNTTYAHTYAKAGNYTVSLMGDAVRYNADVITGTISFINSTNKGKITGISGSLGAVFPTIGDGSAAGTQPRFYHTFHDLLNLTGQIPADLFAGVHGAPTERMFSNLFSGCAKLNGNIPAGLFANINGAPTEYMFLYTFRDCKGLTGQIPQNLFGAFTGAPAESMFNSTFVGCTGITSIANGIWDLSGIDNTSAISMFDLTFGNNTSLTSASPKIAAGSNVELWEKFTVYAGQNAFSGNTQMSNYCDIPAAWGGGIGTATCNITCSAGQYVQNQGTVNAVCTSCPAGTYSAGGTAESCTVCGTGAYSSAGATSCTACSSGFTTSGTAAANHDSATDCTRSCTTSDITNSYAVSGTVNQTQTPASSCTLTSCKAQTYKNGNTCTSCATSCSTSRSCTPTGCTVEGGQCVYNTNSGKQTRSAVCSNADGNTSTSATCASFGTCKGGTKKVTQCTGSYYLLNNACIYSPANN